MAGAFVKDDFWMSRKTIKDLRGCRWISEAVHLLQLPIKTSDVMDEHNLIERKFSPREKIQLQRSKMLHKYTLALLSTLNLPFCENITT